jgi:putative hydrolase of the HAD superfamily
MAPEFIYFDLDNTLLDHSAAELEAQKVTWNTFPELRAVPLERWLETYRLINHRLWEQYQRDEIDRHHLQRSRFYDSMTNLGLDSSKSDEIGSAYMNVYRKHWSWVSGAEEVLARISQKYRTGIITNGFRETQQLKIERLGLADYCTAFLISEDVGKMKPHPLVFDRATEMAGVQRGKILYVGDSYSSDIVGGKTAGWKTAWFTGLVDEPEADKPADFHFRRFDELLNILDL